MDDKLFLIAIGGTGMRCLESFVHMCAAGLFDNHTIDILTIDTDQNNGNKGRVENLIELYNNVKTDDPVNNPGGNQLNNTFFSAKINLYRFFTDYSKDSRKTLALLSATNNITEEDRLDNQDLCDLLFERDTVQDFKLDHGYRAQTHLGSLLMYHGIVEAAIHAQQGGDDVKPHEKELAAFLKLLNDHAATARVFVFGSVFGGTGASSIPVIPLAISDALRLSSNGNNQLNLKTTLFGSTLLTDYFKFKAPTKEQLSREKVIADSNNFALNSQAALSFYNGDATVLNTYKQMYHIGWPASLKIDYSEGQEGDVVTGGQEQENACHVAELMCAAAAYDFFTTDRAQLEQIKSAQYVFRTVETGENGNMQLTGRSFVGTTLGPTFESKLGAFLSFAHLILSLYGGAYEDGNGVTNMLKDFHRANFDTYEGLTDEQRAEIGKYMKEFGYKFVKDAVVFGWIYQIFSSVQPGKFLFTADAFTSNRRKLSEIDPGAIFSDPKHHWDKTGLIGSSATKHFNTFVEIIKNNPDTNPQESQGTTLEERFLAHMYNAIQKAQKY